MKREKLNFTIPEEIAEDLRRLVPPRTRSSFVAAAIGEKLEQLERERLRQDLIEGYKARREEGLTINTEWEPITLESLPEDDEEEA